MRKTNRNRMIALCAAGAFATASAFGQAGGGASGGGGGAASAGSAPSAAGAGISGSAAGANVPGSGGAAPGSFGAGTRTGIAGGAGMGPAGNSTAGTANGTSVNSRYWSGQQGAAPQLPQNANNQSLPPGLQNRQLPPGLDNRAVPQGMEDRQDILSRVPRYRNALGNNADNNAAAGAMGPTNRSWYSNQFGGAVVVPDTGVPVGTESTTATAAGATASSTPGAAVGNTPTAANGNTPSGAVGTTVVPGAGRGPNVLTRSRGAILPQTRVTGDRAFTAADQSLLMRIRRDVLPIVGGSDVGTAPVHFTLQNGVVTLTGNVPTAQTRQQVIARINQIPGVVRVEDQMVVGPGSASSTVGGANSTGENSVTGNGLSSSTTGGGLGGATGNTPMSGNTSTTTGNLGGATGTTPTMRSTTGALGGATGQTPTTGRMPLVNPGASTGTNSSTLPR